MFGTQEPMLEIWRYQVGLRAFGRVFWFTVSRERFLRSLYRRKVITQNSPAAESLLMFQHGLTLVAGRFNYRALRGF